MASINQHMNQSKPEEITILNRRNPWVFFIATFQIGAVVFAAAAHALALGAGLAIFIALLVGIWWTNRVEKVVVSFSNKEATFFYSHLNPFRKSKTVSLRDFTRVYASPFVRYMGWSLHLSGPSGQHLLLARFPSPFKAILRDEEVLDLCDLISRELSVFNGGDGKGPRSPRQ
ncbi:hypothetical protein [Rhodoferax sp.]|uniref:hypothetical protein n=1 Tax=Rhodoferax sp. TaxID=50421 RepID=UPI0025D860C9|nr:hypothetical protein [Rhodoferax sp.]